jgi:hypothetical protein
MVTNCLVVRFRTIGELVQQLLLLLVSTTRSGGKRRIDLFVQACSPKKPATKSMTTTTPMM